MWTDKMGPPGKLFVGSIWLKVFRDLSDSTIAEEWSSVTYLSRGLQNKFRILILGGPCVERFMKTISVAAHATIPTTYIAQS